MGAIRSSPEYGNQSGVFSRDKTHCINGHEFTEENTRWRVKKNGGRMRVCRACNTIRSREHERKKRMMKVILEEAEALGILVRK